jgi:hypothetical protein
MALGQALTQAGLDPGLRAAEEQYRQRRHREPETLFLLFTTVEGGDLLKAVDARLAALTELRRICSQPAPRPVAPSAS